MSKVSILLLALLLMPVVAVANEHGESNKLQHSEAAKSDKVAAVDSKSAKPIHVGELIQTAGETLVFADSNKGRIELAPHSVAEFREGEGFHLLRGSACVENKDETVLHTSSATLTFAGRVLVSYDHKEKSTSAFVLEGQARMMNEGENSQSLRLDRFRGATMIVGEVIPQLIRQLDVGSLDGWLKGYAWPENERKRWLSDVPDGSLAVKPVVAPHLEAVKLENYFSAIDPDDEVQAPDYYDKKYADPDKTVAEANSVKKESKEIKPEEAALISLPSTKIDLGFSLPPQVLTVTQKKNEVIYMPAQEKKADRKIASIKHQRKAASAPEQGDPEISQVLSRLRGIQSAEPVISPQMEIRPSTTDTRGPASVTSDVVPDTVYDYSQNF